MQQVAAQSRIAISDVSKAAVLSPDLDSDLSQQFQKLSKKNPNTKSKALQAIRNLLPMKSVEELEPALPFWAYTLPRLLMDCSWSVRSDACSTMGAIGVLAGKKLAPYLKSTLPPLWLASFDLNREVSSSAKLSIENIFPGKRKKQAISFCRLEVRLLLVFEAAVKTLKTLAQGL